MLLIKYLKLLFEQQDKEMITLDNVPNSYDDWFKIYGDPQEANSDAPSKTWETHNLTWFKLPFDLELSWIPGKAVSYGWMHEKIGNVVVDALKAMEKARGISYIIGNGHNKWGGCYNFRPQRNRPNSMSTHCFGAAVDINPHLGPLGGPDNQPSYIVEAFKERGFTWGGDWERLDSMHFQAGTGL